MFIIPNNEIERIMQGVVDNFLIPKFQQLDMNATGEWIASLEVKAEENKGIIRGRDYSEFLVRGRRPGARPPIAPIERWVNAKLGIGGAQGKGIAFAVATKIAQEGTTWYQKGGSDLLEVLESPACIDYVQTEIGNLIRFYATAEIQRELQTV